jgi:L-amino acid N-acyltransferase YncA
MKITACTRDHAPEILAILNDAIATSTALYDYQPRTLEMMAAWFASKEKGNFPVLGLFDDDGSLAGFASYGTFRAWPAYKYTVEHSVYIHRDQRGRGLGKLLLAELIQAAVIQNYHMMIGGIDSSNAGSVRLHESLGFTHCASIKQAGYKFGRWLDLEFYQLILPTPASPTEV